MSWVKKVDSKKYLFGSLINLGFGLYSGWPEVHSSLWLSYMVIGAALNHFFTISVFSRLVESQKNPERAARKGKLILHIILKFFFLISAFIGLLTFARHKVIQGLLMYIFQLIILFLSIKNIGLLIKKGPTQ
jgi:hypothetical protein